ncbi:MAG: hypothetical protein IKA95_02665 [Clostridia bacterium]|nr:hypothetical protein [Clostridia bacterium]
MKNILKSNTFYAILSVIAAVLIWAYVAYEVRPTHEMWVEDVPVSCINVSKLFDDGSLSIGGNNKGILDGTVTIDVKIRGKRSVVSSVGKKDISCVLDMITVDKAGLYNMRPTVETQYSGVDIIQLRPGNIKFNVENINQHDIDIDLKTTGSLPEGYTIEDVETKNLTVKVTGPYSIVNKIEKARIVLNYSSLKETDSEKSLKIMFLDSDGSLIDSSLFGKSVEYCKVTFKLYTTKEVSLVLAPKYKDEIKKNTSGHTVLLSAVTKDTVSADGGVKIKAKLKGTATALEKYIKSETTVYTEPIDVRYIYGEKLFEDIEAAPLPNDVEYVTVPAIDIKAEIESEE